MAYYNNKSRGRKRTNGRITKRRNGNGRYKRPTYVPVYDKPELKYIDTELVAEPIGEAWEAVNPLTVNCLNAVALGDGETNRDGRVYYIHSVMLKIELSTVSNESELAPSPDIICRLALVQDTQTNQAEIVPGNVFDTSLQKDYLSFRDLSYTQRFKVIKDKSCVLRRMNTNEGSANAFSSNQQAVRFDWYHTFKTPIKVTCSGTSGQVAVVTDNSLQLIAISDNAGSEILLDYQCRIRFSG